MDDDDSRSKGNAVTKTSKLGVKQTDIRPIERLAKAPSLSHKGEDSPDDQREPAKVKTLAAARARKTATNPEIVEQIGQRLRSIYNDVLAQPVPDRFLELLRNLEDTRDSEASADHEKDDQ
jgi:hypothetical protein